MNPAHVCTGRMYLPLPHVSYRLLHPLSPRGKLVYQGLEGLAMTHHMIEVASVHQSNVQLRPELYRLASDDKTADQLQQVVATAASSVLFGAEWFTREQLIEHEVVPLHDISSAPSSLRGGLRLSKGCRVVHVPSYLQGLWKACLDLARKKKHCLEWKSAEDSSVLLKNNDEHDDETTVVWCAGSGLWSSNLTFPTDLPVQLVRGQSLELTIPMNNTTTAALQHALLCGKYSSPLLQPNHVLIGATHEFIGLRHVDDDVPWWSCAKVYDELSQRGAAVWPNNENTTVHRITRGTRVQTARGNHGRLPMIGRFPTTNYPHDRHWIFTGLSSRGLLYHGLYGERLARAVLANDEGLLSHGNDLWWKQAWERNQRRDQTCK